MLKAVISTLGTSLYAVYKAESNANDSLGTYNGTAQGGLTYTAGKSGNAFTGNGTTGWVNIANNAWTPTGDFSISQWVYVINKFDYIGEIYASYNQKGAPVTTWGIESRIFFANYQFVISVGSSSTQFITSTNISAYVNQWVNITVTRKASTNVKIYINGTLQVTQNWTSNPVYDTTSYNRIGVINSDANGSQYPFYNGMKIDEVALFNKELTQLEVTELQTNFYPY